MVKPPIDYFAQALHDAVIWLHDDLSIESLIMPSIDLYFVSSIAGMPRRVLYKLTCESTKFSGSQLEDLIHGDRMVSVCDAATTFILCIEIIVYYDGVGKNSTSRVRKSIRRVNTLFFNSADGILISCLLPSLADRLNDLVNHCS